MKYSPFSSRKPQTVEEAELAAQKAAFFANGGKVTPEPLREASAEVPRFNGKNHSDIGKTYSGEDA